MIKAELQRVHIWARKQIPKSMMLYCTMDKRHSKGKLERANISRKYKYEIEDWIILCKSCHTIFDFYKLTVSELKERIKKKQILLQQIKKDKIDFSVNTTVGNNIKPQKHKRLLRKNKYPLQFYFPKM